MKKACAWCGQPQGEVEPLDDRRVTHGICPSCYKKQLNLLPENEMKTRRKLSKYPPYPGSNWDYAVKMSAAALLNPPNKAICIYCCQQAKTDAAINHVSDCPAKDEHQDGPAGSPSKLP